MFDVNFSYVLPDDIMSGTTVAVSINNVFDTTPPYWNSTKGRVSGSQIGRIVNFNVRKTW